MRRLNSVLAIILVLTVTFIPLAVWSVGGIVDPFTHNLTAAAILAKLQGRVNLPTSGFRFVPSIGFLMVSLSWVTGLSLESLEYLPIAALLFVFAAIVFGRGFMRSSLVGTTIASLLVFRWLPPALSSLWPHTFGFALFLLFVAVYLKLEDRRRWEFVVALVLIFMGVHFLSYTVELWLIAFLASAGIVAFLRKDSKHSLSFSLLLAFIVASLAFNEILYASYIPSVLSASTDLTLGFNLWLSGTLLAPPPVPYAWVRPPSPPALFALNVVYYGLLALPLALLVRVRLSHLGGGGVQFRRSSVHRIRSSVLICLGFVWIADLVSYGAIGAFSAGVPRGLFLIAPLLAMWAMDMLFFGPSMSRTKIPKSSVVTAYAIALLITSVAGFPMAFAISPDVVSPSRYVEAQPGAVWFFSHANGADKIVSDHHTQGQYSIVAAEQGLFFAGDNFYNSSSFDHLVNPSFSSSLDGYFHGQYIVVNLALATQRTSSASWIDFEPLQPHLATISQNVNLLKIYDDGGVWILEGYG